MVDRCPQGGLSLQANFEARSLGSCTRCVRFAPESPPNAQHSLPTVGQTLSGGISTHQVPLKGFKFRILTLLSSFAELGRRTDLQPLIFRFWLWVFGFIRAGLEQVKTRLRLCPANQELGESHSPLVASGGDVSLSGRSLLPRFFPSLTPSMSRNTRLLRVTQAPKSTTSALGEDPHRQLSLLVDSTPVELDAQRFFADRFAEPGPIERWTAIAAELTALVTSPCR